MNYYIVYYLLGIIMLPGIIFAVITQIRVTNAYNTQSKVQAKSGKSASTIAREVLDKHNLQHVKLERISGNLTDNYNPKTEVVSLSEKVFDGTDIASIGIALHEVGHAIQHAEEYRPAKVRLALVPVLNFSSRFLWPLIFIGLICNCFGGFDSIVGRVFIWLGIMFFSISLLFALITLPTELDASKRAKLELAGGYMDEEELTGAKKVLKAAAMTYVASLIVSIISLLRFVLTVIIFRNKD